MLEAEVGEQDSKVCSSPQLPWWRLGASGHRNSRKDERIDEKKRRQGQGAFGPDDSDSAWSAIPFCSSDSGFLEFNQQVTVASTGWTQRAQLLSFLVDSFCSRRVSPRRVPMTYPEARPGLGARIPTDGSATDGSR